MPARPRSATLATAGLILVLLAACSDGTSGSPSAAATDHGAHSPSAAPATEPAETGSAPPGSGGSIEEGPVSPGDYTSDTTGATITFTVADEGWQGAPDIEDVGFALITDQFGALASLSVVAFPGEVFSDPCDFEGPTDTVDTTPSAFMSWLAGVEGVTAEEPTETTVGGRPALVMDLTTSLPEACTDPPWMFLWSLPTVGEFHFADEETVRVWAVEGTDAMVALVAEADPGVDADAFLAAVDEIVASMSVD